VTGLALALLVVVLVPDSDPVLLPLPERDVSVLPLPERELPEPLLPLDPLPLEPEPLLLPLPEPWAKPMLAARSTPMSVGIVFFMLCLHG